MSKYSGKKLNRLIKTWNNGKIPKTKKGFEKLLKRTNDVLASGWYTPHKNHIAELRYIKFGLQEKLLGMEK